MLPIPLNYKHCFDFPRHLSVRGASKRKLWPGGTQPVETKVNSIDVPLAGYQIHEVQGDQGDQGDPSLGKVVPTLVVHNPNSGCNVVLHSHHASTM